MISLRSGCAVSASAARSRASPGRGARVRAARSPTRASSTASPGWRTPSSTPSSTTTSRTARMTSEREPATGQRSAPWSKALLRAGRSGGARGPLRAAWRSSKSARHGADLWDAVKGHDRIWTYLAMGRFRTARRFTTLARRTGRTRRSVLVRGGERARQAQGIATLMEIRPAMRVIEVGNIFYRRRPAAHAARHRGAVSARAPCVRDAGLPPLRMEVQRAQWAFAPRGAALRLHLRGHFPPAHDRKGRRPRHRLVRDAGQRLARAQAPFERWLAPENFDKEGRQKTNLRRSTPQ